MWQYPKQRSSRQGGVYIAVLGTALIVSVLGLTAVLLQRVQNRLLIESADIVQAQRNAETAVELAQLMMTQDDNWRSNRASGRWLTRQDTGAGTATLDVVDQVDGNLADDPDQPVLVRAFGYHGETSGAPSRVEADQRLELLLDPVRTPLDCLRAGQQNQQLPNWSDVFDYYQTHGTELAMASLPNRTPNSPHFSRNHDFANNTRNYWIEQPPGLPAAVYSGPEEHVGHDKCLQVDRNDPRAGAANSLNVSLLKPATRYRVAVDVHANCDLLITSNWFRISLITQYADNSFETFTGSATQVFGVEGWKTIYSDIDTPAWPSTPTAVYLVINSDCPGGISHLFNVDNLDVYEQGARFIYRGILTKDFNQLYSGAPLNADGIYWIDCAGQNLVIERSRIEATLLLINPGASSRVAYGPIAWSPALPGYPALIVNGNFAIQATNQTLSESENGVNYNPIGASHPSFGDDDWGDGIDPAEINSYNSQIRGLIATFGDLSYQNNPPLRGQVVTFGTVTGSADFVYSSESLLSPPPGFYRYRYERRPGSIVKAVQN